MNVIQTQPVSTLQAHIPASVATGTLEMVKHAQVRKPYHVKFRNRRLYYVEELLKLYYKCFSFTFLCYSASLMKYFGLIFFSG